MKKEKQKRDKTESKGRSQHKKPNVLRLNCRFQSSRATNISVWRSITGNPKDSQEVGRIEGIAEMLETHHSMH